jgi:hypothetical protein
MAAFVYQVNGQPGATQFLPILIILSVEMTVVLGIGAIFCYFISSALAAVPAEHRQNITPGQVWLLLIPLFNLFWNFIVFQRVPDAFASYFEATGRPQPGDYGRQLGLVYSILVCCTFVPCLGLFSGLAALILLIILCVKFSEYKSLIRRGGGTGFTPIMPPSA